MAAVPVVVGNPPAIKTTPLGSTAALVPWPRPSGSADDTAHVIVVASKSSVSVGPEPVPLLPNLWGLEIDAATESARYVGEVKEEGVVTMIYKMDADTVN